MIDGNVIKNNLTQQAFLPQIGLVKFQTMIIIW